MKIHSHQKYIEGIKQGNAKIIKEIYTIFFPDIKQFILKNRGNNDDAHDIFQEGLYMLHHEILHKNFQVHTTLNNWLFIVCRNLWYKTLNKKAKHADTIELSPNMVNTDSDIEQLIILQERKKLYLQKFELLSDACQKILTLFFEKTKMNEIARQLNYKNANVVKKKKSLCQKKLTELITSDKLFDELSTN